MRKKYAFFLSVVMITCSIIGVVWVSPDNKEIQGIIRQGMGCVVAEAAEYDEKEEDVEIAENVERITEQSKEKKETSGDTVSGDTDQKEADEKSGDAEKKKDGSEEVKGQNLEEAEMPLDKEGIYNVSFPTDSRAYLDPDNLSGRGQIFSDEFKVENYGNTDISIKIKNVDVYYRSAKETYELAEDEITDKYSDVKKLNVDIIWKNEQENTEKAMSIVEGISDEKVLDLKASEYDGNGNFVRLNEGSTGLFYFTGSLNSNPELEWEDGEVIVSFGYEIVGREKEQEEQQGNVGNEELDLNNNSPNGVEME